MEIVLVLVPVLEAAGFDHDYEDNDDDDARECVRAVGIVSCESEAQGSSDSRPRNSRRQAGNSGKARQLAVLFQFTVADSTRAESGPMRIMNSAGSQSYTPAAL